MNKIIIIVIIIIVTSIFNNAFGVSKELYFFGMNNTNIIVVDPLNRQAGYDISTKQKFLQIPNSGYILSGFGDSEASIRNNFNDDFYALQILNPIDGIYKIKITGNKLGNVLVTMSYPRPIGSPPPKSINYISDINKVDYFEINYSYATGIAGQIMPVTHIASSSTLIDDITIMQKVGYTGNAKFVSELIKEINDIEAEKAKGKIDDGLTPAQKAKKEYTELLSEITEKYNKPEADEFVKEEAYTVLKEDIEYIINHL